MEYNEMILMEDRIAPCIQKIVSVKADKINSNIGIESEGYTGTNRSTAMA